MLDILTIKFIKIIFKFDKNYTNIQNKATKIRILVIKKYQFSIY